MLTLKQRAFAEQIATGATGVEAYSIAYGLEPTDRQRRKTLAKRACELKRKPAVAAFVQRLMAGVAGPEDEATDGIALPTGAVAQLVEVLDGMPSVALRSLGTLDLKRLAALLEHFQRMAELELAERSAARTPA